jgi:hypothetical protein
VTHRLPTAWQEERTEYPSHLPRARPGKPQHDFTLSAPHLQPSSQSPPTNQTAPSWLLALNRRHRRSTSRNRPNTSSRLLIGGTRTPSSLTGRHVVRAGPLLPTNRRHRGLVQLRGRRVERREERLKCAGALLPHRDRDRRTRRIRRRRRELLRRSVSRAKARNSAEVSGVVQLVVNHGRQHVTVGPGT